MELKEGVFMFKRLQGFVIGFMVCALLFGGVAFAAELRVVPNTIPIFANSEPVDIQAYNIDGYTFAKYGDMVKVINKALGQEILSLKFDEVKGVINLDTDKSITIYKSNGEVGPMSNSAMVQTAMQEDTSLLPDGATYVDNEKDGKQYKTILLNGVTYISTSSLEQLFGIRSRGVDVQNEKGIYEKDGIKIYLDLHNPGTVFFVGGLLYVPIDPFSQYMS
jgi:hypothetical protein